MITPQYYDRLAQIESGGDPNARNPKSSAAGLFQFTAATAEQYGLDDPTDPVKARQAVEKFTADNAKTLETKLGRKPTEGELYLAHQQGAGGALKLLEQPDAKAIEVLGVDEVLNNGGNENMTAKEFADKWTGKFGNAPAVVLENDKQEQATAQVETAPQGQQILLPDGNIIQLTGQETPEQKASLKAKIFEKYGNSNINIDRKSGAPSTIRAIVGSVQTPEDRLATLQKYYPDAFAYGEDNFVFKNPDTGKITLYNPKGLDWGDAPSLAREAVQVVGSSVGAAGGAIVGAVGGPVGVTAGAMTGSGLGTSVSGSVFDTLMNKFGLTVDERTPEEVAMTFAAETAAGAIGEGIGRGVVAAGGAIKAKASQFLGGGTPTSKAIYSTFKSFGIEPSASMITGTAGLGRAEAGLAQTTSGATIIAQQSDEIINQTNKAVSEIIAKVGKPRSTQGAGAVISDAAIGATERFKSQSAKIYEEAFDAIGEDTPVKLDSVKALKTEIMNKVVKSPSYLGGKYKRVISEINAMLADEGQEGVSFSAFRQIRTSLREDLGKAALATSNGSEDAVRGRLYDALTMDMSKAAQSAGDEAAAKLANADKFYSEFMNTTAKTFDKIDNFDADEKAYKYALGGIYDGGTMLNRLRDKFLPEEWDVVAATTLERFGKNPISPDDAFSIDLFVSNWNRLSKAPEAKQALFGGDRYKGVIEAMDTLVQLGDKIKEVAKYQNKSNTAGALQTSVLLYSAVGGAGFGILGGDNVGAAQGVFLGIGAALAPRYAAKLITSPAFVKWLSEPMQQTAMGKTAASITKHIARLSAIVQENPELEEPVNEYIKVLEINTKE